MDNIIETVSTIFRKRYGTHLKIDRSLPDKEFRPVFVNHWDSPFVYSRTLRQVSFPIFNSKKELQAMAVASPVENKDAVVFIEMAQFLQLTIAEHFELRQQEDFQLAREEAIAKAHNEASNVINLKTKKADSVHFEMKPIKPKKEITTDPVWICGDNENLISQIAFAIHDWTNNWAFINAQEIPDLIWHDPSCWENFPQVTIYVPNIDSLDEEKVEILKSNLKKISQLGREKPTLIVSSQRELTPELEELRRSFKSYQSNRNVSPRVQAHFLLYHHKTEKPWIYECKKTNQIYFLPFSEGPKLIH